MGNPDVIEAVVERITPESSDAPAERPRRLHTCAIAGHMPWLPPTPTPKPLGGSIRNEAAMVTAPPGAKKGPRNVVCGACGFKRGTKLRCRCK